MICSQGHFGQTPAVWIRPPRRRALPRGRLRSGRPDPDRRRAAGGVHRLGGGGAAAGAALAL